MQRRQDCCDGKIRHRNRTGAIIHLRKLNNAQMNLYPCPWCLGWHVGHSNREHKIQARLDQLLGPDPRTLPKPRS